MRAINITAEKCQGPARIVSPVHRNLPCIRRLAEINKETVHGDCVHSGEFAALCKGSDRIEVVTHAEYLNDTNKIRWVLGECPKTSFGNKPRRP
jgi:hypothetical protein